MNEETYRLTNKLECGLCGQAFACVHKMVDSLDGQKLNIPHCIHCYFDNFLCPDKHGYQCADCEKNVFPMFNPKP